MVGTVLSCGCVGPGIKHHLSYGLLLKHLKSSEMHWLHPDLTVSELTQRYEQLHLEAEWRSEGPTLLLLRCVRFEGKPSKMMHDKEDSCV